MEKEKRNGNSADSDMERWREVKENWNYIAMNKVKSPDDLKAFAEEIVAHCISLKNGDEIYNDTASGATALALAGANMCAHMFGMTGFQMGCVLWGIIDKLCIDSHDVGMRLLNYNNLLYPQYEYKFEKTITKNVFESLQKKASEILEKDGGRNFMHKDVVKHLRSIVDGVPPFGFKVVEDER